MKTIRKRLQKLERSLAPGSSDNDNWSSMACIRDEILLSAKRLGIPRVTEIAEELNALGPTGLWRETLRACLEDRGFVQTQEESFAETIARALAIEIDELRFCIANGQVAAALLHRFGEVSGYR